MYRIRFHGRGGQGLKVASRILGSAFFACGYQVQDAPRYGAERRGAPILAYVRASRHAIAERGVIVHPDLVVVADDTLLSITPAAVLQGVTPHTALLVNSTTAAATWRERLKLAGPLVVFAAGGSTADHSHSAHAGAACAGAAARLTGMVNRNALGEAVKREVAPFGESAVDDTLARVLAAHDACAAHQGLVHESPAPDAKRYAPPQWVFLRAEPSEVAAPRIHAIGNSAKQATGAWRTMRPVIDYARCNRCSWICSTHCPDSAIAVEADHTPRIDYAHCKGCLVCTTVCPPHAVSAVPESEAATP